MGHKMKGRCVLDSAGWDGAVWLWQGLSVGRNSLKSWFERLVLPGWQRGFHCWECVVGLLLSVLWLQPTMVPFGLQDQH